MVEQIKKKKSERKEQLRRIQSFPFMIENQNHSDPTFSIAESTTQPAYFRFQRNSDTLNHRKG